MYRLAKLVCCVLLGAAAFGVAAPATAPAERAKKLLFFGNSYTYTNDIPGLIKSLAVADGHPAPNIVSDLKGGANLSRQVTQATQNPQSNVAHPTMAGQTFDFVIMQGHSHEPYDREDFIKRAVALFQAVRADPSGQGASAIAVLYQTWASAEDTKNSQKAISGAYLGAAKAVIAATDKKAACVAPVGDAFGVLKFDKSLYKPDGSHPSPKGSLLSAMVLYRTLYAGEKVGDLVYADVSKWSGVTAAEWTELAAVADGVAFPDPAGDPAEPAPTSRPAK